LCEQAQPGGRPVHHDCHRARRDVLECCGSSSNVFDYVHSEEKDREMFMFYRKKKLCSSRVHGSTEHHQLSKQFLKPSSFFRIGIMWSGIWKSKLNTRGLKLGVRGGFQPGSHSLLLDLLKSRSSFAPLGSKNSHFFK
jgi:hypothetical protein